MYISYPNRNGVYIYSDDSGRAKMHGRHIVRDTDGQAVFRQQCDKARTLFHMVHGSFVRPPTPIWVVDLRTRVVWSQVKWPNFVKKKKK